MSSPVSLATVLLNHMWLVFIGQQITEHFHHIESCIGQVHWYLPEGLGIDRRRLHFRNHFTNTFCGQKKLQARGVTWSRALPCCGCHMVTKGTGA